MNLIWIIPAKESVADHSFAISIPFPGRSFFCQTHGLLNYGISLHLIINGQEREIKDIKSLAELVRELDISVPHFAVAVNSQVISKSEYDSTVIRDGDNIEIVHAVGGGL